MSSLSTTASAIQSHSVSSLKLSLVFPRCISSSASLLIMPGMSGSLSLSNPLWARLFTFSPSVGRSRSQTSIPALATWPAIPAPIVPAPMTPTFIILFMGLFVK